MELTSGDIFGFTIQRETRPEPQILLVYPKLVPLTVLGLPALRPFGDHQTPRRLIEDPLRVMGAREYAPGDSYRHIHWKATARRQALQTKVFDPSAARPLAIFLNVNTYERLYEGSDPDLQEFAITAAASIARWAWDSAHAVGLYVNSTIQFDGRRIRVRPGNHPDQLVRVLEALAQVVPYGRWPIEALVQAEARALPYGTTVVVVSAVVNDRLRYTLMDLHNREYGVALVTLGQAEMGMQVAGVRHYHIGGREEWYELASLALA